MMVGLPARGKTYMARKLARYLHWIGIKTKVFNVGDYRRDAVKFYAGKEFFDPDNAEAVAIRNQCAQNALEDMCNFLQNEGEVAIFDATNTTRERRRTIYNCCTETYCFRVFFVESICDSQEVIEANIREVKLKSPDYKDIPQAEAVVDFLSRIELYEKQYEPIDDKIEEKHYSFIKIYNCGERFLVHKIGGNIQSRVVYFLMNIHVLPRTIYLTMHGESEMNVQQRIGRNSPLSPTGKASYHDLVARLESVIMELERAENVLVITHQAVIRCILAYFLDKDPERLPYMKVPLHTVIKLTPMAYGCMMERIPLSFEATNTNRSKLKNCEPNLAVVEALNEFPRVRPEIKIGPRTTQVIYQNTGTAFETTDAHGNRIQRMDSTISDVTWDNSFPSVHDSNI
ncbi:unnamed protein product [Rotaria sp. Silwood1]|nr:unnamed protein product [Rotaria sp. Silwood1]